MSEGISINVGIKNAAFKQGLEEMRGGIKKFKGELGNMAAGAIGFGAVAAAVTKTINYADTIADLAQRFGVGTTELQRFGQAAEQNGSSLEAVASGLNKLEIARSKALAGDEEMIAKFAKLNVSMQDLKSATPEQLLLKIGSSSMDAATMVGVLGKSSLELVPTLRALADGSAEFGEAMDEGTIQKLAAVSDGLKALSNTLTVTLGGALVWVSDTWQTMTINAFAETQKMVELVTGAYKNLWARIKGDSAGADAALKEMAQNLLIIDQVRKDSLGELTAKPGRNARPTGDPESADAADKQATKREERLEKIRKAEEDAARAALDGQEKINALIADRERLLATAAENPGTDAELDAMEEAARLQRQIDAEQKKAAEEQARQQKDIADAREKDREDAERYDLDKLQGADKIAALEKKKAETDAAAGNLEATDPKAAAEKRMESRDLQREIDRERGSVDKEASRQKEEAAKKAEDDARKQQERDKSSGASIKVSSLQEVGGGGNVASAGNDPSVRELTAHTRLLQELVRLNSEKATLEPAQPWR